MKVDKETLLKHRFWIGLGVFALLWVLLLLFVPVKIGGAAAEQQAKYTKAKTDVGKIATPRKDFANDRWVEPLKKKEDALKTQKDKVWKASWETQKDLMDWPGDSRAPLDKELRDAYFLDKIADPLERQRFADTLYAPQWNEFKDAVAPAYWYGGSYEAVIRPITAWTTSPPTSDECWLAQEDFWVKRDMVGIIRQAIDKAGAFLPDELSAKDKQALPAGVVGAQRFHNGSWEVTVLLEMAAKKSGGTKVLTISPKSTIKNIDTARRRLPLADVVLEIQQRAKSGAPRGTAYLSVEGEPLEWDKAVEIKKPVQVDTFVAEDPLEVRQVFNWSTCPIKRVDRIEIGTRAAESHRTSKYALQTKSTGPKDDTAAADTGAVGGIGPGGGMGPMGGTFPPPGMIGAAGQNGATLGTVERNRYVDLSDQCRRMPVALVLIIDQDHLPDVLTAVANSKLHTWVTQYEWQHVQGIPPPSTPGDVVGAVEAAGEGKRMYPMGASPMMRPPMGGGSGTFRPPAGGGSLSGPPMRPPAGAGSMMRPAAGVSGMMRPPMAPMGPMGMTVPPGAYGELPAGFFSGGTEAEQDDPNLIELTVYGIASLYERYPPKAPSDTTQPGQPNPTTTPAPAAAPAAEAPATPAPAPAAAPTPADKTTPVDKTAPADKTPPPADKPDKTPPPADKPTPAEAPAAKP
jgi:hypothetical protein